MFIKWMVSGVKKSSPASLLNKGVGKLKKFIRAPGPETVEDRWGVRRKAGTGHVCHEEGVAEVEGHDDWGHSLTARDSKKIF